MRIFRIFKHYTDGPMVYLTGLSKIILGTATTVKVWRDIRLSSAQHNHPPKQAVLFKPERTLQ